MANRSSQPPQPTDESTTDRETDEEEENTEKESNSAFATLPEHNETISKKVIDDTFDGKRRVKRTYRRVISHHTQITFIHTGDTIVRAMNGEPVEDEIVNIGPNISRSDGMHVVLADCDTPIHLNLIRKWIKKGDAFIQGRRHSTFTELEGVDY